MNDVRRIGAQQTWPLRQSVLRPGRPEAEVIFAGDDLEATTHWGAFDEKGEVVAIASLYRAPKPGTREPAWQLRGMASDTKARGLGYGAAVLAACLEYIRTYEPDALVWCNAREGAAEFYRRYGFSIDGEVFDIPTVGPHFVMSRKV